MTPSFSARVKDDLRNLPIRSACCRRAYLYGLLYSADICASGEALEAVLPPAAAPHAESLVHTLFSRTAVLTPFTRGAHRYVRMTVPFRQAAHRIAALRDLPLEEAASETIAVMLDFRCEDCAAHFLRGLFEAVGSVSNPSESYHLEFKIPDDGRAEPVRILLAESGSVPGRTGKNGIARLFFKSSEDIQEVLSFLGAASSTFDFINALIQRDIRNNENRATNCVAENIHRTIQAGGQQFHAVRWLEENGLLPSLPDELQYTAMLRKAHPEVSLSELAALHSPAITKSGVHHRLEKILDFYEKAQRKS